MDWLSKKYARALLKRTAKKNFETWIVVSFYKTLWRTYKAITSNNR